MKLQSNKNVSAFLVISSCLVFLSLGAYASAGYASLPEESFSYPVQAATTSSEQKSLGDFGQVLSQRLIGVWQEVRGLFWGSGSAGSSFSLSAGHGSASDAIDVNDFVSSGVENSFSDIAGHPHARYINLLAQEDIVAGTQGKFYPDNYLRLYDLIKMTVDLYRVKVGYSLTGEQWLSLIGAFSGDDRLPSRYVATASHLGFFSHISGDYTQMWGLQRFVDSQDMRQMFTNISYQFSGMIRKVDVRESASLTRGEAAKYLVMAFDVSAEWVVPYDADAPVAWTPFADIVGHQYQTAITTLAQLGIVSTDASSFSPDNYLHRYDFVILLVNSLLVSRNQTLSPDYISGFVSPFVDVGQASYSPFVFYAYKQGLLDYLIINKRGENYFLPDTLMTKHEIYTLISKATGKTFAYDVQQADQEYMTRGEVSQILVDLFGFTPPEVQVEDSSSQQSGWLLDQLSILLQIKELFARL